MALVDFLLGLDEHAAGAAEGCAEITAAAALDRILVTDIATLHAGETIVLSVREHYGVKRETYTQWKRPRCITRQKIPQSALQQE